MQDKIKYKGELNTIIEKQKLRHNNNNNIFYIDNLHVQNHPSTGEYIFFINHPPPQYFCVFVFELG